MLSLPVGILHFIDGTLLCYGVLGLSYTLAEFLIVALLLIYQALLALFCAFCFQLACVRLEETRKFAPANHELI